MDSKGAYVSCRCYGEETISMIKKHLHADTLREFEQTCFGRFLSWNPQKHQGQMMYILMQHLKDERESSGMLTFSFKSRDIVFGPKEYFLMTGLSFGPPCESKISSSIHEEVFSSNPKLKFSDIQCAFLALCKGNTETTLKLALLLVLYGILLCRDKNWKIIDLQYLHIVDDIQKFNLYPWGLVSYGFLIENMYMSRKYMLGARSNGKKPAYDIYGLSYAIQSWAFEVFPELGRYVACPVKDHESIVPRIFRWYAPRVCRYSDLVKFFRSKAGPQMISIILLDEEKQALDDVSSHFNFVIDGDDVDCPNNSPLQVEQVLCNTSRAKRKIVYDDIDESIQEPKKHYGLRHTVERSLSPKFDDATPSFQACDTTKDYSKFENELLLKISKLEEILLKFVQRTDYPSVEVDKDILGRLDRLEQLVTIREPDSVIPKVPVSVHFVGTATSSHMHDFDQDLPHDIFPRYESSKKEKKESIIYDLTKETEEVVGTTNETIDGDESYTISLSPALREKFDPLKKVSEPGGSISKESMSLPFVGTPISSHMYEFDQNLSYDIFPRYESSNKERDESTIYDLTKETEDMVDIPNETIEGDKSYTISVSPVLTAKFDPSKKYNTIFIEDFSKWYDDAQTSKSQRDINIPLKSLDRVNANWFEPIWKRYAWLDNGNIDVLLNMLILKSRKTSASFLSRWSILESICWLKLGRKNFQNESMLLLKYVNGELPLEGGVSWFLCDKVYGVAHVLKTHWVAYEINFEKQCVTVYDSMSKCINWENVRKEFETCLRFLPWLCKFANIWEIKGFHSELRSEWEIKRYEHPPQQVNGHDCGIMAVKFIECLVSGHPVEYIDPNLCGEFRCPRNPSDPISLSSNDPLLTTNDLPWLIGSSTARVSRFKFWNRTLQRSKSLQYILINTFLEGFDPRMQKPSKFDNHESPRVLEIGPLIMQAATTSTATFWEEDTTCLDWLDKHNVGSVMYISFGSWVSPIGEVKVKALALALEGLGRPFIWVLGPAWHRGLPDGYTKRVAAHGRIVQWAPQLEVLQHPAVGCYLTHCGWNSTMEAIQCNKPLLCYPIAGDQLLNCAYIVNSWRIGVKIERFEIEELEFGIRKVEDEIVRRRIEKLNEKMFGKEGSSKAMANLSTFMKCLNT